MSSDTLRLGVEYMNNQVHRALFRKEGEGKEREEPQPQRLRKIMYTASMA